MKKFSRGIEPVVSVMVFDKKKRLLFVKDPKWKNKWKFPGGHIEVGESIFKASVREVKEETGLIVKALEIIDCGEKIASPSYHRLAHFVYFTVACFSKNLEMKINKKEISDFKWLGAKSALAKLSLGPNDTKAVKKFIKFNKNI
ncbi:MAG: NUDIX hydrolase [Patescibacteria group bacterium]|jgi:ADP-ribose pyrophosphatase YjhB (NUDIX family)